MANKQATGRSPLGTLARLLQDLGGFDDAQVDTLRHVAQRFAEARHEALRAQATQAQTTSVRDRSVDRFAFVGEEEGQLVRYAIRVLGAVPVHEEQLRKFKRRAYASGRVVHQDQDPQRAKEHLEFETACAALSLYLARVGPNSPYLRRVC